jgi:hypothetical protein
METYKLGQTPKGRKLNEDNLNADVLVIWNSMELLTGNRYHTLVELYNKQNQFVVTVPMEEIAIIKM